MSRQSGKYYIFFAVIAAIFFSISVSSVGASTATESLSNPYKAATNIKAGSIVSLDSAIQDEIVAANTTNEQRLIGVTINSGQSLLAVNDATNTTQVVYEGLVDTLVSTLNGSISIGSQIAISPISGVGAKDIAGGKVVGIAEASFNSSTSGSVTENIYDTSKHLHKIYVGYIPVLVSVSSSSTTAIGGGFLNSLRSLVSNIAGHTISNMALLLICIIAVLAFVSIIVLIYGAITGGLISIGRNPLAKSSIFASLGQIFIMVFIIAATSITIIYFILH